MAGYSGTPLAAKLGIKTGTALLAVGAPADYRNLLAPVPDGVAFASRLTARIDLIHVFSTSRQKLGAFLGRARRDMRDDAAIWVSWPKKAAAVPTDLTEDVVRELKRAYRLFFKSELNVSQARQRAETELKQIPEVVEFLRFFERSERGAVI